MINSSNYWPFLRPQYFAASRKTNVAAVCDPLLFKVFEKAAKSALGKLCPASRASFRISELTEPQSRSAFNFLSGNDTFVSLPTGHCKSLIYQICPMIAQEVASVETMENRFPSDPMLVVISPLNSLIADQINSCERMGLKACKVELETTATLETTAMFRKLVVVAETENLVRQYFITGHFIWHIVTNICAVSLKILKNSVEDKWLWVTLRRNRTSLTQHMIVAMHAGKAVTVKPAKENCLLINKSLNHCRPFKISRRRWQAITVWIVERNSNKNWTCQLCFWLCETVNRPGWGTYWCNLKQLSIYFHHWLYYG